MTDFESAVLPIVNKWKGSRRTRFAKNKGVSPDDVIVFDEIPIPSLEKQFKAELGLKIRSYKNLSEDQKNQWLQYYDSHKSLKLMTLNEHETFTKSNNFNVRTKQWDATSQPVTSGGKVIKQQPATPFFMDPIDKPIEQPIIKKQIPPKTNSSVHSPKNSKESKTINVNNVIEISEKPKRRKKSPTEKIESNQIPIKQLPAKKSKK